MKVPQLGMQAVLVLALLLAGSGRAQPVPQSAVDCVSDPECLRLFEQGKQLAKAGQIKDAKRAFEQAYQYVADPILLWKLARLFDQAGRLPESRLYYQKYLDSKDPAKRVEAQQRLQQLPSPTLPPPPAVDPPSATLTLVPAATAPGSPRFERRWARKGWLWALVGVGAAGIAVGVGLGLAARRPDVSDAAVVRPYAN